MGRERLIPILALGHSKWIQRAWLVALLMGLSLGYYATQNWWIPVHLEVAGQRDLRLACAPSLCPMKTGDTLVSRGGHPYRLVSAGFFGQSKALELGDLGVEQALLYLPLLQNSGAIQKSVNFTFIGAAASKISSKIGVRGLFEQRPIAMDSLRKWNRSLDSAMDFPPRPLVKISFWNKDSQINRVSISRIWDKVQLLDGSKQQILIPRDSILGTLEPQFIFPTKR